MKPALSCLFAFRRPSSLHTVFGKVDGRLTHSVILSALVAPFLCGLLPFEVAHAQNAPKEANSRKKVTPIQSAEEGELIMRFSDGQYTFSGILKYARDLEKKVADRDVRKVIDRYITTLELTVREQKNSANEKNEIKKLVYSLRDETEFAFFIPKNMSCASAKLLALGKKAIPYLIEQLDNESFTRSVSVEVVTPGQKRAPTFHVLRVGDCACGILREITGKSFGDAWYIHGPEAKMAPREVAEEARQWWRKQK